MKQRLYITRFTKDIKNVVKDCLVGIFHKKSDLIDFFHECGSTSTDMVGIEESLTKSSIIDIYFDNLERRKDSGTMQYHSLIRNILDWSDFESYWFENGKLDAKVARQKIGRLKTLLGDKTEKEEERLKAKERKMASEKTIARSMTMDMLRQEFYEMCRKKDGSQKRGYQLEAFLQKVFGFFGIDVFKPFKLLGEQIDGAMKFEGDNYIFEAKWHDVETACNALYVFAYKISGNTLYPRGLFFSMNGYTEEAVQRITHGKSPELLLFDAVDFVAVLEERINITKLLEEKIRYAQTRSMIYVNAVQIMRVV